MVREISTAEKSIFKLFGCACSHKRHRQQLMTHLEALYHFIGSDVNQCALYLCCEWVHQEIRANGLSHSMKFFKVWSLKNYFAI